MDLLLKLKVKYLCGVNVGKISVWVKLKVKYLYGVNVGIFSVVEVMVGRLYLTVCYQLSIWPSSLTPVKKNGTN